MAPNKRTASPARKPSSNTPRKSPSKGAPSKSPARRTVSPSPKRPPAASKATPATPATPDAPVEPPTNNRTFVTPALLLLLLLSTAAAIMTQQLGGPKAALSAVQRLGAGRAFPATGVIAADKVLPKRARKPRPPRPTPPTPTPTPPWMLGGGAKPPPPSARASQLATLDSDRKKKGPLNKAGSFAKEMLSKLNNAFVKRR